MSEAERLALAAVKTGQDMRAAQTEYFKTTHNDPRKAALMAVARMLERKFDREAAAAVKASEGLAL